VFAYFEMIKCMMFLFTICSIIMLPALLFFRKEEAILDGTYAEYSLGSLYQAKAWCFSSPLAASTLLLTCNSDFLTATKIFSTGLIPVD